MASTFAKLITWTIANSTYSAPAEIPEITYQSSQHFVDTVCESVAPCRAKGYYKDGSNRIVLHESYRELDSIEKQALVIHEITHYLQDKSDRWRDGEPCDVWIGREEESFRLQLRYISVRTGGINLHRRMPRFDREHCEGLQRQPLAGE